MLRRVLGGWRRCRVACATAGAVALSAGVLSSTGTAAAAEAPRWVLTATPSPTNIMASTPRNEVQKVTVNATGGTFALGVLTAGVSERFLTGPLPYDATASEVQSALESLSGMADSASVAGGPGTATPHEYEVTFEGAHSDIHTPLMTVESSLEGGSATVSESVRGAAAPQLIVTATNVGGAATDGSKVTMSDLLPSWLKAEKVAGFDAYGSGFGLVTFGSKPLACSVATVTCTYEKKVDPGDQLIMYITMSAGSTSPAGAVNQAQVEGGGASVSSVERPLVAGAKPSGFGPLAGSVFAAVSTTQAGAHPSVTASFEMNTRETDETAGDPKDVRFDLPPGLVGSTVGMPRCSMNRVIAAGSIGGPPVCPDDSMVGMAIVTLGSIEGNPPKRETFVAPVYNIAPSPGEPAAFAFDALLLPVRLDTTVLSDGNYGVRVTAPDISEAQPVVATSVTIWGVPAEHSGPGANGEYTLRPPGTWGGVDPGQSPVPLMTNPQECDEPMVATMSTDAWANQGTFISEPAPMGTLTGCELVPFSSSFTFLPDTLQAGAPAGYQFNLTMPQQNEAGTLATSSVKAVSLKLPAGVVVNPSAAWGLKACSTAQFYGPDHPSQEPAGLAGCPREAQIGEVEVETPDLEHVLKGQVFLGAPECDPCTPTDAESGKMVRLFIQLVGEGEAGIIVKLEGRAHIDQQTGQITIVFEETPQVPFNRMRFVLEGGPRAVLANPRKCGTLRTTGDLTPWNTGPEISDSTPFYEFQINQNCFGPQFAPSFKAGMPNIQAGAFGEFTLAFGRKDSDEYLGGISVKMPPGLLGKLAGVERCPEAQANVGTCAASSEIGTVEALTGPGANPFLVGGGHVFLTAGYGGAPFGLSIVVPAVAGPYTLGGVDGLGEPADNATVVVRSQIFVSRDTAQLTVVSGQLPGMLDGIPLQLKAVNVRIDRPGFMFNPTSCAPMGVSASINSLEGANANVSSSFQVANCARLRFKPELTASTSAKTSRADGASLTVKLAQAGGGGEANIHRAKVELPKILPSRLSTLQKACTEAQFEANPAGCPAESIVGHAVADTPILSTPLEGPAYFVSRGARWPELIMVLQGEGVTIDLAGETFISKSGVTSTTLGSVPDAPVSTFELTLPMGSHSALAANGDLCAHRLTMPTEFVGQNGAQLSKRTPIEVEGCPKALRIASRSVKGRRVTVKVYVPAAGKLKVSGKGLTSRRKTAKGHETLKLTLRQRRAGKLVTRLQASFTPKSGVTRKRQSRSAKVSFAR